MVISLVEPTDCSVHCTKHVRRSGIYIIYVEFDAGRSREACACFRR